MKRSKAKTTSHKPTSILKTSSTASTLPTITTVPDVIPMDVDAVQTGEKRKLTPEEHEHCFKNNLCLYCGKPGHQASACFTHEKKYPNSDQGKVKPESK